MKSILPALILTFAGFLAQAECPKMVRGMETEPELSRIEAASDFSVCNETELEQIEERMMKQVNLYCPAGLKSLTALDSSKNKDLSNDDVRTLLSCASRKSTLALIRVQRTKLAVPVRQAIKDL